MRKATKEAKVNTSWINPNQAYDDALQEFVSTVLDDFLFRDDFQALRERVAQYGMYNSLSQAVLKLTAPGVPDIYQGTETWDFSLVDPDNRRPVDYDLRRQMLNALQEQMCPKGRDLVNLTRELLETWRDGRIKLYATHRALTYRREHPELFLAGAYTPLEGIGPRRDHVCAFARQHGSHTLLAVAPRFLTRLTPNPHTPPLGPQVWQESWLSLPATTHGGRYSNLFTGESVTAVSREGRSMLALGDVFAHFPVALLAAEK
jgi:(1->4)-alpha-D-glucan 1-alpha-D-glucosylmutase